MGFSGSPRTSFAGVFARSIGDVAYTETDRRTMLRGQVGTAGVERKAEFISVSANDDMILLLDTKIGSGAHAYQEDGDTAAGRASMAPPAGAIAALIGKWPDPSREDQQPPKRSHTFCEVPH